MRRRVYQRERGVARVSIRIEDLKACPFCEGRALGIVEEPKGWWFVTCRVCGACGSGNGSMVHAVLRWDGVMRKDELNKLRAQVAFYTGIADGGLEALKQWYIGVHLLGGRTMCQECQVILEHQLHEDGCVIGERFYSVFSKDAGSE